jgi:hypothetical protein
MRFRNLNSLRKVLKRAARVFDSRARLVLPVMFLASINTVPHF